MPTSTTSSTPSIVPSHPPPLPPTEPSYHPPGHSPQSSSSKSSLSGHRSGKAVSFVGESDDPRKASARDERGSTKVSNIVVIVIIAAGGATTGPNDPMSARMRSDRGKENRAGASNSSPLPDSLLPFFHEGGFDSPSRRQHDDRGP